MCAAFQVQLRKWIRNLEALEHAQPTAKCLARGSASGATRRRASRSTKRSNAIDGEGSLAQSNPMGQIQLLDATVPAPPDALSGLWEATGPSMHEYPAAHGEFEASRVPALLLMHPDSSPSMGVSTSPSECSDMGHMGPFPDVRRPP